MESMTVESLQWPVAHEGTSPGVIGEKQLLTCFLQAYGHVMVSCLLKAALRTSVNKTQHCPHYQILLKRLPVKSYLITEKHHANISSSNRGGEDKRGQERAGKKRFVYLKVHDMRAR